MTATIGLVANVYNEVNALPGWLETHLPFFDDVRIMHAGPQGEYSTDGTLELLKKWRVPVEFCAIDEGFGVVRTRALRMSPCDWVMILDADERFYPVHRHLSCSGEATPQREVDEILRGYDFRNGATCDWDRMVRLGANLRVDVGGAFSQGEALRRLLGQNDCVGGADAVASIRRHWHDFSFWRPTQNWHTDQDWQLRILRNVDGIGFDAGTRMHERVVGVKNVCRAVTTGGPFFDHFHFFFKKQEQAQRAHDVSTYDKIHAGEKPLTREQFEGTKR